MRLNPARALPTAALLLGLLLPSFAAATEIPFTRVDVDVDLNGAAALQIGDLDGDGDDDIVASGYFGDDVVWYENTSGDGTAWVKSFIDASLDYPAGFNLADVDGDGDLDVLVAGYYADELVWYENDLDTAASWPKTIIDVPDGPWNVRAADIDQDGDLDAVATSYETGAVTWYENLAGDGSAWASTTIDSAFSGAVQLAIGDIDQDGSPDVLAADESGDELAWFGNTSGDGSTWSRTVVSASLNGPSATVLADLDQDGDLDVLVAAVYDDEVAWFENTDGAGGAWAGTTIDAAADGAVAIEAHDVDQDGDLDVVVTAYLDDESTLYENVGGSFTKRTVQSGYNGAFAVTADDIDGDGDLDLSTAATYHDDVVFMRNDSIHSSSQGFAETDLGGALDNPRHTTIVDVDGDGDLDVVGGGNDGLTIQENVNGDASAWQETFVGTSGYWATGAEDLDDDGDMDLLGGDKDLGELVWFVNGGVGGYTRAVIGSGLAITRDIDTGDLDGDGDLDVVVTSSGTQRLLWYENDDGVGGSWTETSLANLSGAFGLEVVDLDRDGDLDIVAAFEGSDRVSFFENDGAASFTETVLASPDGPRWARAADYDADGDLDVLVAVNGDGDVIILVNPGASGTWTTEVVDDTLPGGWFAEWADFDLDGDLDIVASANTAVNTYENTAAGWIKTTIMTGNNILHGGVGDLDGDGDLDAIAPTISGNERIAWFRNDRFQSESVSADVAPSVAQIAGASFLVNDVLVEHLGRPGDSPLEVTTVALEFVDGGATPLDATSMAALFAQIDVRADINGDTVCDLNDGAVGVLLDFSGIANGVVTVPVTSGLVNVAAADLGSWCTSLTLTATPEAAGVFTVGVSHVPDEGDVVADASAGITLTTTGAGVTSVITINQPPVADAGGPYTVDEGIALTLDGSSSTDPDGSVVSWGWDCDGDTTYETTGATPSCTFPDDGVYAVPLLVTDDVGGTDTDTATVTVGNVAPTLAVAPPAAVTEGGSQTWTAVTGDVAADTVTVTWEVTDPSSAAFSNGTGDSASVTFPDDGTWTITFTASDEDGGSTTDTQTTVVTNVAPVASIDSGPTTADEGDTVTFAGSATDVGTADAVVLTWALLDSAGASVATGSGASFAPTVADDDTYSVVLTATDDDGGVDTASLTLIAANVAPSFTNQGSGALTEGTAWTYLPTVDEPGADTLTFSLSGPFPAAMTIDASTGQLDWTPTYADVGGVTFTLTVDDGDGGSGAQGITLTVDFLDVEPDGMPDTWETANSLDPTVDDSALDPDADGITNIDEFGGGTDPQVYDGPGLPVAISPIGGEEVDDATPDLTWSNTTDPQGDALTYDVEVYDDASMGTLLDSATAIAGGGAGSTSWTPSVAVAENATAWWRVRAADAYVAGGWTNLESFFVNETNEAPEAPGPAAPLEGDSVAVFAPTLSWTDGTDVDMDVLTYDVEVVDGSLTLVTQALGITGLSWTVDTDLTENAWYSWEARSVDPDGLTSAWTVGQAFFVDTTNSVPADVAWVSPLDGDDLDDVSPVLEVTASSDPEDEALTYSFELDTAASFDTEDLDTADSATPTWDLDADGVVLTENTSWFLRARAADPRGAASGWAQIEVFVRGENDAPAAPVLVAPADGTSLLTTDATPAFVVAHAVDPEGDDVVYGIRVARDEALSDVVDSVAGLEPGAGNEGTADQTSWTPTESLAAGDYFWSASAVDDGGASADADAVWTITIEAPVTGDDDDTTGDDDDSAGDGTGCDCQSSLAATPGPAGLWSLLLLVPALRRRR